MQFTSSISWLSCLPADRPLRVTLTIFWLACLMLWAPLGNWQSQLPNAKLQQSPQNPGLHPKEKKQRRKRRRIFFLGVTLAMALLAFLKIFTPLREVILMCFEFFAPWMNVVSNDDSMHANVRPVCDSAISMCSCECACWCTSGCAPVWA